jgi:hypothetical protein
MTPARDSRGRFTSKSRDNTEDPGGRAERRFPGAFDEDPADKPTDIAKSIERDPPNEDDSSEDDSSEDDSNEDDPSNQLQGELTPVPPTMTIPASTEAKPIKLSPFDIPNLTKLNVRTWKSEVKEFCESQGVWAVVRHTSDRQDKADELKKLLEDENWATQDATARIYIKKNIDPDDKAATRDLTNSGAVWKYLMAKYERRTEFDNMILVRRITQWRKDPTKDIETSLQQLEQFNRELSEASDQKLCFQELMILTMFLDGLPEEYAMMKDSIFSNATLNRGLILSRLQQKESSIKINNSVEEGQESANRAQEPRKCYNCDKPGHFARDCRAPKKDREEPSQGRGHGQDRGRGRNNKSSRGGPKDQKDRPKRGKARAAEEEEESGQESDSGSGNESAFRIELREEISDQFEYLLKGEEPEEETLYRVKGNDDPIIDSGATSTCSGRIDLFESLDQRYGGSLGTAGKSIKIKGRGTMRIPLSSGTITRISNALYVPEVKQTLLSTQALQDIGIWNEHVEKKYHFFKERGKVLAEGYNIGKTSYLGWVKNNNALTTRSTKGRRKEETIRVARESTD